ncbi:UNVERIFIED_CONTAM: hypothetical protein FKN15_010707 [Acipenser sinensis]
MLYSLCIEPLLHQLRMHLTGLAVPALPHALPIQLSAYADDLNVFVTGDRDVATLQDCIHTYERASSARVNWTKSGAYLVGSWKGATPPSLPQTLSWNTVGLKILGVFLGNEQFMQQNWEGLLEKVQGRLQRWQWLLSQLSFKGRVLIINNLAASMLWHRLVCLNPPPGLLEQIQKSLLQFFWSGHHWLRPMVLYLPPNEGGLGLINLSCRVAVFRLQAAQRLLYCTGLCWQGLAFSLLHRAGRLGLDRHLFLISPDRFPNSGLDTFYSTMFNAWHLLHISRTDSSLCSQWIFEEPLFFNPIFNHAHFNSVTMCGVFLNAGLTKLGHLIEFTDFRWRSSRELSVLLGIRSERFLEKMLADLKASLSPAVSGFVERCLTERVVLEPDPLFPTVLVSPSVPLAKEEQPGRLLSVHNLTELHFHATEKKQLYHLCVKSHCSPELRDLVDTKWRAHLGVSEAVLPSWRSLYKLPLPKRSGDLQWRVLHSIVATNRYLSHVEPGVSEQCPFCPASETVFHLFTDCPRLIPFFQHLTDLLASFGVIFSKTLLVFSITYKSKQRQKCVLVNFILGQAKLAIYKSRKNKILATGFTDAWSVFRVLLVSRIQVDFFYYRLVKDLDKFKQRWCEEGELCDVSEEGELSLLF